MIDLLSNDIVVNPYPTLNRMREEEPVCEISPGSIWVVSRFEDVVWGLDEYDLFTVKNKKEHFSPDSLPKDCQSDLFIATEDPPVYRQRRAAISPPFLGQKIGKLRGLMQTTSRSLVEEALCRKNNFEFMSDYAFPYVGVVVGEITGINTVQPITETQQWIRALEIASTPNLNKKMVPQIVLTIRQQKKLFKKIIIDEYVHGKNEFLSGLISAKVGATPLTVTQLVNALELLIRSGFQTVVHTISGGVIQLVRNKPVYEALVTSPELLPRFVDELFRLHASVPMVVRYVSRNLSMRGKLLRENDEVWFSLAGANRDPRHFKKPDEYDLNRSGTSQHIGFGYGPHKCLGLHLAKMEVEVALESLMPLIPYMKIPEDKQFKWIKTLLFRSLDQLPIELKSTPKLL